MFMQKLQKHTPATARPQVSVSEPEFLRSDVKDVRSETSRTPATEFVAAIRGSWARFCPSTPVGLEEEEERLGNNSCLILIHPDDSHI